MIQARPWRRHWRMWTASGLLAIYCLCIFQDLPPPAESRYRQDLPVTALLEWGLHPDFQPDEHAAHWWDKAQGLRGWSLFPEGWSWPKLVPTVGRRLGILALALLGSTVLWWGLRRPAAWRPQRAPWIALLVVIVFAYALELATLWLKHPDVQGLSLQRVTDIHFTGYFTSALQISHISAFFSEYDRTIASPLYCMHCQTHPPGPVLFYWLLIRGAERLPAPWQQAVAQSLLAGGDVTLPSLPPAAILAALLAAHMILLGAPAIAVPLYGLAQWLAGRASALPLAASGAVLPGLILMSPEFDQVYGTLVAGLLYLGLRGSVRPHRSGGWGVGAGLLFAFCLYWSFGLWVAAVPLLSLVLGAMAGIVGAHPADPVAPDERLPLTAGLRWLLGFGVGAIVPWALLWRVGGLDLPAMVWAASRAHLLGITAVWPYVPWAIFNVVMYLQFVGLPLVLTTLLTLVWRVSGASAAAGEGSLGAPNHTAGRFRQLAVRTRLRVNPYGALFWALIVALDLSGATRAEVERLWIFLMPLALMAVFHATGRGRLKAHHIRALLTLQLIVCVSIGGNWRTP